MKCGKKGGTVITSDSGNMGIFTDAYDPGIFIVDRWKLLARNVLQAVIELAQP